jgi:ribitol-5-phosphate 2-dehydrogenase
MLNQVYRLVSPHQFETVIVDEEIDKTDCIIVRPTYLSICHADQRYFTGSRDKKSIESKITNGIDS